MNAIFSSQLFFLTLTIGVYAGAGWLYKRLEFPLLNPLLVSIAVIIGYLKLAGVSYETYMSGTQILDFMLGMSVVSLGYLLYRNFEQVRGNLVPIITAIVVGSVVGIASVALIAKWMGAGQAVVASLQPKSATTPIAIAVARNSGGIPALTSVVVILAGVFGSVAGPFVLRKLGIESRIAKGLALGAASHGAGTARAIELGAVEGAISGLAIGLMGLCTALLVPVIERFL